MQNMSNRFAKNTAQQKVVTGGNELVLQKNNTSAALRHSKSGSSSPGCSGKRHIGPAGCVQLSVISAATLRHSLGRRGGEATSLTHQHTNVVPSSG
jgi:hypothetical protein